MEIQIADHRPALTIALSLAKKLDDPLLPKWQADMTTVVVEVTKKFFGSLTDQQVRKGLEATISLLSLGLFASSKGGVDPEAWLVALQAEGLQGASKRAVDLVKRCNSLPEEDAIWMEDSYLSGGSDDKRRALMLRAIALGPDNFSGYRYLVDEVARREAILRSIQLAEWLLANTTTGRIVKKKVEDVFGYAHPHSDEVCYHIIPRLCGIPEKMLPTMESDYLLDEDRDQDIRLAGKVYEQALRRYLEVVESVPRGLRSALIYNGRSWFERFVTKGGKVKKEVEEIEEIADDDDSE